MFPWRHLIMMLLFASAAGCGKSADDRADLAMTGASDMPMSMPDGADLTRNDTDGAAIPDLVGTPDIAMQIPDAGVDLPKPPPDILPTDMPRPDMALPICIFDDDMSRFDDRCVFGP